MSIRIEVRRKLRNLFQSNLVTLIICAKSFLVFSNIPFMRLISRHGESREVVHGSLFLCSDDASYIHGTMLHVGSCFELL